MTLSLAPGECVAIVGEAGAGRTTLLHCFNRLVDADEGRIIVDGEDVRELDPVLLRRRIGYLPAGGALIPHWTVGHNVALVPSLRKSENLAERVDEALRKAGLEPAEVLDLLPRDLTPAQHRRVALARALADHPVVVLLDEPFVGLDAISRAELQRRFAELRNTHRITVLFTTDDLREAMALGDRVAVLWRGHLEQVDRPDRMVLGPQSPYVSELFIRAGVR